MFTRELLTQFKNILSFVCLYIAGVTILVLIKYLFGYSDYLIPSLYTIIVSIYNIENHIYPTWVTLKYSIISHLISTVLAIVVGSIISFTSTVGSIVKAAAYSTQALPIIALAPVIFILFGSQSAVSRIVISTLVCYFAILLTIAGALSDKVPDVEQFYEETQSDTWTILLKIRLSEHVETIMSGVIGSAVLALVGSVVAEFLAAQSGIGRVISAALNRNNLEVILSSLLALGVGSWLYLGFLQISLNLLKSKFLYKSE